MKDRVIEFFSKFNFIMIILIVCAIVVFLIPFVYKKTLVSELELTDISYTRYVRYDDEPLRSAVLEELTIYVEETDAIEHFLQSYNLATISIYNNPECSSEMVFFHTDDGRIINAYLKDDKLGLNFGQVWINIDDGFSLFD